MRLVELEPKWLNENVFSFLCPHCRKVTLLCKNVVMSFPDQVRLVNPTPEDDHDWPIDFIPMNSAYAWKFIDGPSFETLTVTPSIDASGAGHWHGYITNGDIR